MQPGQPILGAAYGAADVRQRPAPPAAVAAPPGSGPLRAAYPTGAGTPLLQPRPPYSAGNAAVQPRRGAAPSQRTGPAVLRGQQATGAPFAEEEESPQQPPAAKAVPINKNMFLAMGLVLLAMLCFLPIWDSIEMLRNLNYAFWGQRGLPVTVIIVSCMLLIFFFFTTEAFFGRWKNELHTTQSLVVMASLFITLLGLMLVLVSLPLSQKAIETHNDIVYQCSNSQATRKLRTYYMGLLQVRRNPDCLKEYSVEECPGYWEEKPYAGYLKALEGNFRCSGFCYQPAATSMLQANATNSLHRGHGALLVKSRGRDVEMKYPPTLFSQANFEASCDGAAARNLINFTRDTGYQMWYMGIVLIALSICMGLWEWSAYVAK
mmetsp:Transcript_52023/g.120900  ORF Transcript_52023/g.120900 Transcript_52023/m.120900 type:complete len:377 (+) Transcript_52023:84-1214(+)